MYDSGVRSGTDVVRAYALGAAAAFAGKAYSVGPWRARRRGARPRHRAFSSRRRAAAFGQLGAHSPEEARSVVIRHNGALKF